MLATHTCLSEHTRTRSRRLSNAERARNVRHRCVVCVRYIKIINGFVLYVSIFTRGLCATCDLATVRVREVKTGEMYTVGRERAMSSYVYICICFIMCGVHGEFTVPRDSLTWFFYIAVVRISVLPLFHLPLPSRPPSPLPVSDSTAPSAIRTIYYINNIIIIITTIYLIIRVSRVWTLCVNRSYRRRGHRGFISPYQ